MAEFEVVGSQKIFKPYTPSVDLGQPLRAAATSGVVNAQYVEEQMEAINICMMNIETFTPDEIAQLRVNLEIASHSSYEPLARKAVWALRETA